MSRQRITQELDAATRQALIELVRKHPERRLSELLSMDNVGHRVGELTVGELIAGTASRGTRARSPSKPIAGPPPSGPAKRTQPERPEPISTRTAAEQTAHDNRILAAMAQFDHPMSIKELREEVPEGSDYQLASAIRRLLRKRKISRVSRGRGARYLLK